MADIRDPNLRDPVTGRPTGYREDPLDPVINPTVNNTIATDARPASRGMGGVAAVAIIAVVAFLAYAVFSGGDNREATAPVNSGTPAVEGTENPSTGSINNEPAAAAPTPNTTAPVEPQAAPSSPSPAPMENAPADAAPAAPAPAPAQ